MNRIATLSCALLAAMAVESSHADVIVNGSFEVNDTVSADNWVNTRFPLPGVASTAALGANDGTWRAFLGNDTDSLYQVTSATIQVGDVYVLDFFVNSADATGGRTMIGTLFFTNDGGTTRTALTGTNASLTGTTDGNGLAWEQANAAALSYTVLAGDAGIGGQLGVEFTGSNNFRGVDSVSLDVVPEPGSLALLGLGGLLIARRRRA